MLTAEALASGALHDALVGASLVAEAGLLAAIGAVAVESLVSLPELLGPEHLRVPRQPPRLRRHLVGGARQQHHRRHDRCPSCSHRSKLN